MTLAIIFLFLRDLKKGNLMLLYGALIIHLPPLMKKILFLNVQIKKQKNILVFTS
jgi:hypothetical protein